ncbi:MAG: hypothetical protein ACI85I_002412 [Arenicella sp.]|jgi:hypothetical protein
MKKTYLIVLLILSAFAARSQGDKVYVRQDDKGMSLIVNEKPFMINGMNWDYFPIGTNFSYSLWNQSDELIKSALDYEMSFLKGMGVNSVRMYTGVPQKWI